MCVGATLQCGYGGVVSVCRLKHVVLQPAYGYVKCFFTGRKDSISIPVAVGKFLLVSVILNNPAAG